MTDASAPSPDDEPENEVLRETRRLEAQKKAAADAEAAGKAKKGAINWKTAAGIGIGSAALLAAVLYASRDKD